MIVRWIRDIFIVGTACFFAVMWGLVLRERVAPPVAPPIKPDYDALLPEEETRRESVMGIYMGRARLGQTHTIIERDEMGETKVHNITALRLGALPGYLVPSPAGLEIEFFAEISPLQGLRVVRVLSDALGLSLVGIVEEDHLRMRGTVGHQRFEADVPYDGDLFLGETFAPLAGLADLKHARVGDAWTLQMVNPLAGSLQQVRATIESRREVELDGQKTVLFRLLFYANNRVWHSWIAADGEVWVQGTPFGLTLRRDELTQEALEKLGEPLAGQITRRHW